MAIAEVARARVAREGLEGIKTPFPEGKADTPIGGRFTDMKIRSGFVAPPHPLSVEET